MLGSNKMRLINLKFWIIVLLLFVILGMLLWFARKTANDIPFDEYNIITDMFNENIAKVDSLNIERLVIVDSTYSRYNLNNEEVNLIQSDYGFQIPKEIIIDFQNKNKNEYKINRFFDFKIDYVLISENELDHIFGDEPNWGKFYDVYPKSSGIIYFSRIGINQRKNEALLYYDIRSAGLSGAGYFIYLKKENGKWKDAALSRMWVS